MADLSKIEWCDATLNLWWGCTKVSDGCKFCYANDWDSRYHPTESAWGPTGKRREVKSWRSTLNKISKRAKAENRRLKVFCQSMSDTFEGPETMGGVDSENWKLVRYLQDRLFEAIWVHHELDFLILTKRPDNALKFFEATYQRGFEGRIARNTWIGTSVENQATADERIPHLLQIPAAVRFLSCEPLLGPVDLTRLPCPSGIGGCAPLEGRRSDYRDHGYVYTTGSRIHWVICGSESGPNARPMHPDWARSLRDQCQAAGVPFFFKQWGEWMPENCVPPKPEVRSIRVGKARAGRLLDGREWNEFPEVANG